MIQDDVLRKNSGSFGEKKINFFPVLDASKD